MSRWQCHQTRLLLLLFDVLDRLTWWRGCSACRAPVWLPWEPMYSIEEAIYGQASTEMINIWAGINWNDQYMSRHHWNDQYMGRHQLKWSIYGQASTEMINIWAGINWNDQYMGRHQLKWSIYGQASTEMINIWAGINWNDQYMDRHQLKWSIYGQASTELIWIICFNPLNSNLSTDTPLSPSYETWEQWSYWAWNKRNCIQSCFISTGPLLLWIQNHK